VNEFKINWMARDTPLLPTAVAAHGPASLRLARRLLQLPDESLSQLEGVAGQNLILVQGTEQQLPWVDGVQYLGIDPAAPLLLLPTNYRPSLPEAFVQKALLKKAGSNGRIAVLPSPLLLVPIHAARPVFRSVLAAWLEKAQP